MRKYFILLACLSVTACKNVQEEECCPENPLVDSVMVGSKDEPYPDSAVVRITESLEKSENIEENIKNVVETSSKLSSEKVNLLQANSKLKTELKCTKDSLIKTQLQLKETLTKLPKKRNFLQKVLGTGKDSIEVITTDTIKN